MEQNKESIYLIDRYIDYIFNIKRYSDKTVKSYNDVLKKFCAFCHAGTEKILIDSLTVLIIRSYEAYLIKNKYSPKTVNHHLSVLSSFSKFLLKLKLIDTNPINNIHRPKMDKDLPVFYRAKSLTEYFEQTEAFVDKEALEDLKKYYEQESIKELKEAYERRLKRLIISLFYSTGIRRGELIDLQLSSLDFYRKVLRVRGKGDKVREIPLLDNIINELLLYMEAVDFLKLREKSNNSLLLRFSGESLYPVYVDRVVKCEFADTKSIRGRKSPHVLRHSLATELLNKGAELNSIKEMLGHTSLAATQVYTHNSIEKLKAAYLSAHPRVKKQ